MKKIFGLCLLTAALILILAGCGDCDHEWADATCIAPKTCTVCGETEGEPIAHSWEDATCLTPKTCSVCGATAGAAGDHIWVDANCSAPKTCSVCGEKAGQIGGHIWIEANCSSPRTCSVCQATEGEKGGHIWAEANCSAPKTCTVCGETEGEKGDHLWQDATCVDPKICAVCKATEGEKGDHKWEDATTEAPKTCSVCHVTTGDKLQTDSRFTTASTKVLQGTWVSYVTVTGDMVGLENFKGLDCILTLSFGNTGNVSLVITLKDPTVSAADYRSYAIDKLYSDYAKQGLNKDQADQNMIADYGMTVPDYVDDVIANNSMDDLLADYGYQRVYYVEGGVAYTASGWSGEFAAHSFSVSGNTLTMPGMAPAEVDSQVVWKRG